MGAARDDLHRRLDALGVRLPSRFALLDLLDLAAEGHPEWQVAGRVVRLVRRWLAERRDEEERLIE